MRTNNKMKIKESDIRNIVKDEVRKYLIKLNEGIDINDETMQVSFNSNHQNYVDTNDPWNPYPIYNEVDGYQVISIFKRKMTNDKQDGNPLIYALKNGAKKKRDVENGVYNGDEDDTWTFSNPKYDVMSLLRRFVAVTKELRDEYDVIITTPSSNPLNTELLYKIVRLIPHENSYENFFVKYQANDVYRDFIDTKWISKTFSDKDVRRQMNSRIYKAICQMNLPKDQGGNDGVFSYKFIKPSDLRNAIIQSMHINDAFTDEITFGKILNGKRILIIDDTVTSGKTISDSATAFKDMYDPESITFLTLLSPLSKD